MMTARRSGCEASRIPAYILAGGHSRRFGSDKARAVIGDKRGLPMIVALADSLRGSVSEITVVAREAGAYADLGLRTIADVVPDKGPLGGILTAIEDRGQTGGWIFVSACDWVGVRGEWVDDLAAATCGKEGDEAQVVVFKSEREQPLFGLYHASLRAVLADRIARGELKTMDFLNEVTVIGTGAPAGWEGALNMNRGGQAPRFGQGA
jgi:molybdopterin-guanine dinucleotide biosynthesis protein A